MGIFICLERRVSYQQVLIQIEVNVGLQVSKFATSLVLLELAILRVSSTHQTRRSRLCDWAPTKVSSATTSQKVLPNKALEGYSLSRYIYHLSHTDCIERIVGV